MNRLLTTSILIFIFAATYSFAATPVNPFTGEPIKASVVSPKTDNKVAPAPTPFAPNLTNPYLPAPSFSTALPQQNQQNTQEKEKKKEIKPEERYVIDGIVDNNVILIDQLSLEKYMQVDDMTILDNGCLVKYPSILCGDHAKKALKRNEEKDALAEKVLILARENTNIRNKNANITAKINEYSKTVVSDELKIKQMVAKVQGYDSLSKKHDESTAMLARQGAELANLKTKLVVFDKTLSEKEKTDMQFGASKKAFDAEIINIKKTHENETELLKKNIVGLNSKINLLQPQLENTTKAFDAYKIETKDAMQDMAMLTSIVFRSSIGTDYNIPKIGKFKGVLHENLIFAFVPVELKTKADVYMSKTMLRAYKTSKYILYINKKNLVED